MEDRVLEGDMAKTLIMCDSRYFIVIILLSVVIFFSQLRSDGKLVPLDRSLEDFPKQIVNWEGEPYRFSQAVYDKLGVDDSIAIDYKDENGDEISMYIGYYESQKKGEIIHSPKNCMLGSGWQPEDISESIISIGSRKIPMMKMIVEKHSRKMVVLYWYQSGNRAVANEYTQRLYFVYDSLRYNRTNAAFIRFSSIVSSNDDEGTVLLMEEFINKVVPILDDYLPN